MHSFPTLKVCVCVCVLVGALKAPSETLSEPQPVPLAMIMTTLSRAIERQQKKIVVCFLFTSWALRQRKEREKGEIKIWHFSGRGMGEVFYFSLLFSSSSLLLSEHSRSDPGGRAAILVSCPAGTISRRRRVKREAANHDTKKYLSHAKGGGLSVIVKEKGKARKLQILHSPAVHLL